MRLRFSVKEENISRLRHVLHHWLPKYGGLISTFEVDFWEEWCDHIEWGPIYSMMSEGINIAAGQRFRPRRFASNRMDPGMIDALGHTTLDQLAFTDKDNAMRYALHVQARLPYLSYLDTSESTFYFVDCGVNRSYNERYVGLYLSTRKPECIEPELAALRQILQLEAAKKTLGHLAVFYMAQGRDGLMNSLAHNVSGITSLQSLQIDYTALDILTDVSQWNALSQLTKLSLRCEFAEHTMVEALNLFPGLTSLSIDKASPSHDIGPGPLIDAVLELSNLEELHIGNMNAYKLHKWLRGRDSTIGTMRMIAGQDGYIGWLDDVRATADEYGVNFEWSDSDE